MAQVEGYLEALRAGSRPDALRRISIVDRDSGRVQRLRQALTTHFAGSATLTAVDSEGRYVLSTPPSASPSGGAVR